MTWLQKSFEMLKQAGKWLALQAKMAANYYSESFSKRVEFKIVVIIVSISYGVGKHVIADIIAEIIMHNAHWPLPPV